MSSINSRRDVGHGVGGLNASINNVSFCPGAWAGWVSDEEAFFANGADGWIAAIYDQRTKTSRRAVPDPSSPQYGAGINFGFAGGGVWAGWLAGSSAQRGVFTNTGLHFHNAGLLDVGPDGALAFKPDYQSLGPTMVLEALGQARVAAAGGDEAAYLKLEAQLRAEGLLWQLSALSGGDLQLLGDGRAIWQYGHQ